MAKNKKHLFFGKAGHLFVMSELLLRNWNVAMPEVDIGDDVFVVRDIEPDRENIFLKVQVKSSKIRKSGKNRTSLISTSVSQLLSKTGTLMYFFIFREEDVWKHILIINRDKLLEIHKDDKNNVGGKFSIKKKKIIFNFTFNQKKIFCSQYEFTSFYNDWSEFTKKRKERVIIKNVN